MAVVIYHNPRCSKSRETLALLEAKGAKPKIVEYLKEPPSAAELKAILKKLGLAPRELMRRKEPPYAALKLDNPKLSDDALVEAMVENPVLIERPIVVNGAKAALGRPPEDALKIL
ncbi:MAG: arsenate reductase (glutaredoxin) [Alphaproteobacteria bacterium]|nr:arsenate reductase (glutaredoxin) [Alphaproteobacteria bacterium]